MTLTKKEAAELKRLNRKIIIGGRGTRKEVLRALDLKRKQERDGSDRRPAVQP